MKKQLITVAIASTITAGSFPGVQASELNAAEKSNSQYIGTGIGAVAGGLLAGPVGVLAGGLIGNLAGRQDATAAGKHTASDTDPATPPEPPLQARQPSAPRTPADDTILVSQAGDFAPIIAENDTVDAALKNVLIEQVGLDVLFLTGSTSVETIYLPRLQAIASIMQLLPEVEVHLDGYSDRRGDSETNLDLSTQRLESVRNQLLEAGADASRIHQKAFGEQQFVSSPGDLDAYTFDRRVVIRFEFSPEAPAQPVALIEADGTP